MFKIIKYVFLDIIKNKTIIIYTVLLFLIAFSLLNFEDNPSKAVLSILNITLIVVPLISIIFTTIHFYNSYELIELMIAQPVKRIHILLSEYSGCALSLVIAYLVGIGIPIILYNPDQSGFAVIIAGVFLTLVFVSFAFLASVISKDKAKGIGFSLLLWFYFSLLYDGIILLFMMQFSDYPIENFVLGLTFLNPVDLARIFVLMKIDVAALMGYSGAIFENLLGSNKGIFVSLFAMVIWIVLPLFFAIRVFNKKDI